MAGHAQQQPRPAPPQLPAAGSPPEGTPPATTRPPASSLIQNPPARPAEQTDGPAPSFALPVQCSTEECFVQNYVDVDPGAEARDYTCGLLTYDKHTGVDIRVPNMEFVRRGIPVVAAAPGIIRGARDGMDDVNFRDIGEEAVRGKECGNGVLINHGNGWVSQYCHMRKGSIGMQNEQQVKAGDRLGPIGMSGKAEFPHVHFEVRLRGKAIDPFTGAAVGSSCDAPKNPVFAPAALNALSYRRSGLLNAGFARQEPKSEEVLEGKLQPPSFAADAPQVIFWAEVYGLDRDDRQRFVIRGPNGRVVAEKTLEASADHRARSLSNLVATLNAGRTWPAGVYRGEYSLERKAGDDWEVVFTAVRAMEVAGAPAAAGAVSPTSAPPAPGRDVPAGGAATASPPATTAVAAATAPPRLPPAATETERQNATAPASTIDAAAEVAASLRRAAAQAAARFLKDQSESRKGPPMWLALVSLLGVLLTLGVTAWVTRR
ncbi:MAG: M23 family metallopeptidase [Alphaproteobacteria bacterium]|nr:M23 family metallopeptidase [Alphaproteobacteria bacterium]